MVKKKVLSQLTNTETLRHQHDMYLQSQHAEKKFFGTFYAITGNFDSFNSDLCFPVSGGFGGGFYSDGDGGRKGRKMMGGPSANRPPAAKKPRTCGICHMPGHTRVTCPQR